MQDLAASNETIIAQLEIFLSHTFLNCVEPPHISLISKYLHSNTYWYNFFWTKSGKSSIYLQSDDFSAKQEVMLVSQHRILSVESSLFFLFFEQNGVFYWSSHHQVVKGCWGKSCINSTSKDSVYLPPSDHFPSRSHYFPDQATSSLMCLCVVHLQVRPLRSSSTETLFG